MPKVEFLKSEEDLEIYSIEEYTKFYREFEDGIEYIDLLEKRLKRKKITYDKSKAINLDDLKKHLAYNEEKYFDVLTELFEVDDESPDLILIQRDLSFYVHNKYAIINYLFEWETELLEENKK